MKDIVRGVIINPNILDDFSAFTKHYGFRRSTLLNYALVKVMIDGSVSQEDVNHIRQDYLKTMSVILNPAILDDFSAFAKKYEFKRSTLLNYALLKLMMEFNGSQAGDVSRTIQDYLKKKNILIKVEK